MKLKIFLAFISPSILYAVVFMKIMEHPLELIWVPFIVVFIDPILLIADTICAIIVYNILKEKKLKS